MTRVDEEIIEFLAAGTTPSALVAFQPSVDAKARVADLMHREKTTGVSADETIELNHYLHLEHVMRVVKACARAYGKEAAL
jgi:hypothetical protein